MKNLALSHFDEVFPLWELNLLLKLDTWFNGKLRLQLTTGEKIEVSRRRSQQIKELFSI